MATHAQLDTTDALAALLEVETDEVSRAAISVALNERRSVALTLAHQLCWHITPAGAPIDTGPDTAPIKPEDYTC